MLVFSKKIKDSGYHSILNFTELEQGILYIDIETTGFNRQKDMIYLVGLIYLDNSELTLTQFLCEKVADEYELLYKLNNFITDYDTLVHFNGDSFDLPFIQSRMGLYLIRENISALTSYDYYKKLKPFRRLFQTDNLKLKTLETVAGFTRMDKFSGGDLIALYRLYLEGDNKLMYSFILHNEEDMVGLYYLNAFKPLIALYSDDSLFDVSCLIQDSILNLNYLFSSSCPYYSFSHYSLNGNAFLSEKEIRLELFIYNGHLKLFYNDYKDYYYLPVEDYAIHKSVASFVHSNFKKKATKETAYIKKEGIFIKCPLSRSELLNVLKSNDSTYLFMKDYTDSSTYILLDDFVKLAPRLFGKIISKLII